MLVKSIRLTTEEVNLLKLGRNKVVMFRLMRPQPEYRGGFGDHQDYDNWGWEDQSGNHVGVRDVTPSGFRPGLILWVKEGWAAEHPLAIQPGRDTAPSNSGIPGPPLVRFKIIYRADGDPLKIWRSYVGHPYFTLEGPQNEIDARFPSVCSNFACDDGSYGWCPANDMPRSCSRFTLLLDSAEPIHVADIAASEREEFLARVPKKLRDREHLWAVKLVFQALKENIDSYLNRR